MKSLLIIWIAFAILAIIGEIRCIVKAIQCNWNPVGKAEVLYISGSVTGAGCIIGWFNIKDE